MSNFSGFSRRAPLQSSVPRGDVLASFESYTDAQDAINKLAKAEFDVKGIAIVGRNLTTVEIVTARLSYGRAALAGASTGAWLGLFFGLISTIIAPITTQQVAIFFSAIVAGAGIGMIFQEPMTALNPLMRIGDQIAEVFEAHGLLKPPERRARALGYGAFCVTNIFAWRDTDPRKMRAATDPVGPANDDAITQAVDWSDRVIAAWGTHGAHLNRGPAVETLLRSTGRDLYHLGLSKAGHPKHPLYIAYSQQPELWAPSK